MDQQSTTIPTQPWVPDNSWPNTTPNPFIQTGFTCEGCGGWIPYGVQHQCPGRVLDRITTNNTLFGMMTEISAYADFVKLLRRDTLQQMKDLLVEKLLELEQETPTDSGFDGFGIDVIVDVFDDVAKSLRDKSSV